MKDIHESQPRIGQGFEPLKLIRLFPAQAVFDVLADQMAPAAVRLRPVSRDGEEIAEAIQIREASGKVFRLGEGHAAPRDAGKHSEDAALHGRRQVVEFQHLGIDAPVEKLQFFLRGGAVVRLAAGKGRASWSSEALSRGAGWGAGGLVPWAALK